MEWGLFTPAFPGEPAAITAAGRAAGRRADHVLWYEHWTGPWSEPDAADLDAVRAAGATPIVTWMPDDPAGTGAEPSLASIAAGDHDAYARRWARALAAFGDPVLLRFAHEPNGDWYPWSPGVGGSTAAAYVTAWRHLHALLAGAGNVRWVWSPNVVYDGSSPLGPLFPGDAYVDVVGIDGYNWGTVDGHRWQSPAEVFAETLRQVRALTRRPVLLTEVGCAPAGGDKAAWITDLFRWLAQAEVTGLVWFDADKETDWRFAQTPATLAAFGAGVAGSG